MNENAVTACIVESGLSNAPMHLTMPNLDELEVVTPDSGQLAGHRIVAFDTAKVASRPFNLLRSQVAKRVRAAGGSVIGITSAAPGAGKSLISANLAASLALKGDIDVFLMDLDLRRASMSERFGLGSGPSLTNWLSGDDIALKAVGKRIEGTRLAVFPCSRTGPDSAELLTKPRFLELMTALKAMTKNAIIFCDMPPVFASDDAVIISQQLDGYFDVVDEGITSKKQLVNARALLAPAVCLGTILNRYRGSWGDAYGYGTRDRYSQYYDR